MLQTEDDFQFDSIPENKSPEYRISPNDVIQFRLFANDGFQLIDITSGTGNKGNRRMGRRSMVDYQVDHKGKVKLPILGWVDVEGYTIREAELMLEKKYSEYYNKPFVMLKVTNRRVIVFPGSGGDAQVITLKNNNVTVIEALALAGGLSERGKAKKIKLIRRRKGERKVFLMDLSTIKGMDKADMVVQANDIIYVEPTSQVAREVLREVTPIVSLLSSAVFVYSTVVGFNN
ncbi:MAG: polysaccharide biosynthesis/export family protein [Flavobacteriales bacterium]